MPLSQISIARLQNFLRQLTQQARSRLLIELERIKQGGEELLGSDVILADLYAEFRKNGKSQDGTDHPRRYFFEPLEPFLISGAAERANSGQISRGSLTVIWEWIRLTLLPTMASEYSEGIRRALAADKPREARVAAVAFQTKISTYLAGTLASSQGTEQVRAGLSLYTSSPATFGDLVKMGSVLRARDALAASCDALPQKINNFDDKTVAKVSELLNALQAKHPDALPFALSVLIARLKTPWQLIRLATKPANSKAAANVARTPYAIAVSMVLDYLDDKRFTLHDALKRKQILIAKDVLTDIYAVEYALRVRIDQLDQSAWGEWLNTLMQAVTEMVDAEVQSVPKHLRNVQHVLESRSLRSHDSLIGRLIFLAWKSHDALLNGASYCRRLIVRTR
ncbi:MAG: hypothetical protein KGK01_04985 [Bradyrhizobium sp.]|nr:hypothetical protein [Bradyrhizobium sp.]